MLLISSHMQGLRAPVDLCCAEFSRELQADKLQRSLIGQEFWAEPSFDLEFSTDA